MRTIFAEYNPHRNSIDVYTSAGYMLRIDCWEAENNLKTTPGSDCAINALAIYRSKTLPVYPFHDYLLVAQSLSIFGYISSRNI